MRPTPATISAGTLLIAISLSACTTASPQDDSASDANTNSPVTPSQAAATTPPPLADGTTGYRDGTYTATGWYGSKPSHHDLTLTIDDGAVTDVEITTPAEDQISLGYQQRFAAALPDVIIGRSIKDLNVDRVAGSSGCSEGFMDALAKIKDQAAA
jgi:uncharacterized protein with FMN-binding domain